MIRVFSLFVGMLCLSSCHPNPIDAPDQAKSSQSSHLQSSHLQSANDTSSTNATNPHSDTLKVITPDWGIAAELTAIGHPPVATGDNRMYQDWMGESLPTGTQDLGIRYQPNPEMIKQMDIDMVIDNFFYQHIRPMYGDVPIKSVLFKSESNKDTNERRAIWQDYVTNTLKLGDMIGQPKDAQDYVVSSEQVLKELGDKFRQQHPHIRKLAIVQFADVANLRMYASNSLYQPTLDKMGLELVTFDVGNDWGFVNIQLGELDRLDRQQLPDQDKLGRIEHDTCLIVVKPFSEMLQEELNKSALWQKMGFGQAGENGRCMAITDPVWMYGGIASMTSFANKLVRAKLNGGAIKTIGDIKEGHQTSEDHQVSHSQGGQL